MTQIPQAFAHIDTWIFDLDNTLYPANTDFFSQIDRKMTAFISQYLDLQPTDAKALQKKYLSEYGTSLSGLIHVHDMDPAEFLHDVHDVDMSMLKPDPNLQSTIQALPGRKYIFTNGSRGHAKRVAGHLGLWPLFDGSFAIEDADYVPKPKSASFTTFCDRFTIDPYSAIFFEDSLRNLEVPKQMGMTTVWVQPDTSEAKATETPWVDYVTQDLAGWLATCS